MDALPRLVDLIVPTLAVLRSAKRPMTIDEIESKVSKRLSLDAATRTIPHRGTDPRTRLAYRLAWVRCYLRQAGYIEPTRRGVWQATAKKDIPSGNGVISQRKGATPRRQSSG